MNSPTSQLQQNFARPGFWQGQLTSASVPPSASVVSSASVVPSAFVASSVVPSASVPPSASLVSSVPFSTSVLPSDSTIQPNLLPAGVYQQNVIVSPQPNSSISAPLASLVHPSSMFSTHSTVNPLHTSHSTVAHFPFSAGVSPMMNPFEMISTDTQMFPQTVRLNPNLAFCSSAPFGGYAKTSLPTNGTVPLVAPVGGSGLHHFSIPRLSQQSPAAQPAQGLQFSLGQSTFFGGDSLAKDARQQQQTQHLFDLSNSIMSTKTSSSLANANVISMAAAISKGSLLSQYQPQQTTKQRSDCASQPKGFALCDSSEPSPLKQSADSTETVKIPKEIASIPLERSCASSSSAGSVGDHRSQQQSQQQMSCQVCYLAASNGLHFGARTCAACAAFFRRSISDQKRYICKRSQRCIIRAMETQGYRKMCRNCRMKRCLEIGMLPENVQNKRNKRDFYFADALSNAINQQQRQQQQMQMNNNARGCQSDGTDAVAKGEHAVNPPKEEQQRQQTETHGKIGEGDINQPVFGGSQLQNTSEYQQQHMTISMAKATIENGEQQIPRTQTVTLNVDDQTKLNSTTPWGITFREV